MPKDLVLDDSVCNDPKSHASAAVVPIPIEFPRHAGLAYDTKPHDFHSYEEDSLSDIEIEDDDSNQPLLHDNDVSVKTIAPDGKKRLKALGYIVFSAFNFSLMSALIKYASMHHVTSYEAVFWRMSIAWVLNYGLMCWHRVSTTVPKQFHTILLIRCLVGSISMSVQFYAMTHMVLTDAVVIIFTSPVITFLMGAVLLKESIGRVDFACALVSYVGVLFVIRPVFLFPSETDSSHNSSSIATICAMLGAFTQACAFICMRKLHQVHHMVIIHYFLMVGTCLAIVQLVLFQDTPPFTIPFSNLKVLMALIACACLACVGQLFMTLGFQQEKAGIASVMRYFDVVFVVVWDTTLLHEQVDVYSLLGGCIILLGAIVIAIRRAQATKG